MLIVYFIVLFFSVVGLCDVIHTLKTSLWYTKKHKNKILICLLSDEKADVQLGFVAEQYRWFGRKYADKIYAVKACMPNEVVSRCERIAFENDIDIIDLEDVGKMLSTEL